MTDEEKITSLNAKRDGIVRAQKMAEAGWGGLSSPGYITWQGKRPDKVVCKCCSTPVMQDGQRLPTYREVQITFSDKSAHVTQVCANCALTGFNLRTLEAVYCADLLALATEEDMQDTLMRWELMAYRQINGFTGL